MSANSSKPFHVRPGQPLPLGMREIRSGLNFAAFSRHGRAMRLILLRPEDQSIVQTIHLEQAAHRTGDIWHAMIEGDVRGLAYAVEVDGPADPASGHRFDGARRLFDPYASGFRQPPGTALTSLVPQPSAKAPEGWEDDCKPRHSWSETVIYELHLAGYTKHPSAGTAYPGTYRGLIDKIPHLRRLGITAVELMPIQQFATAETLTFGGATRTVRNYWGYSPISFFAPHCEYAVGDATTELRALILALHRAGIEVFLDLVFNHTAELGEDGPTFSLRGLDNSIYYMLDSDGHYRDFTGCGNTVNCNHPVVRTLIVDALRHWVIDFHVDGFRFDLASVLGRAPSGELLSNPPLLEQIAEDPILRDVKLIAEAWDAGGAFQVGHFPGIRWAEWNSCFRDDLRRFWRGDRGMTGAFATRLCGSADLFGDGGEGPLNSVNFVASHDGFTLNDLVSFARKHNEENGQGNRDGRVDELSENNGCEGPTEDPGIEAVRVRQIKNMLVSLFVARGVPMLLAGDEFRRTQRGNSNPWHRDDEVSWVDWRLADRHEPLLQFTAALIAFRQRHPILTLEHFYANGEIEWLGEAGTAPNWHGPDNLLGCVLHPGRSDSLALLFNACLVPRRFRLPASRMGSWRLEFDTAASGVGGGLMVCSGETELPPRTSWILTPCAEDRAPVVPGARQD